MAARRPLRAAQRTRYLLGDLDANDSSPRLAVPGLPHGDCQPPAHGER